MSTTPWPTCLAAGSTGLLACSWWLPPAHRGMLRLPTLMSLIQSPAITWALCSLAPSFGEKPCGHVTMAGWVQASEALASALTEECLACLLCPAWGRRGTSDVLKFGHLCRTGSGFNRRFSQQSLATLASSGARGLFSQRNWAHFTAYLVKRRPTQPLGSCNWFLKSL